MGERGLLIVGLNRLENDESIPDSFTNGINVYGGSFGFFIGFLVYSATKGETNITDKGGLMFVNSKTNGKLKMVTRK